ncbi:PREDICTED: ferric reduction oxidase 2-like [Erythranthe guttata]|nr:PREDICTED: ferric reduction oxidase 2-like [Erythranthe guttata]|eukprot:XP_012840201.1 PREDICTED: ferric reduction oxidase 2-like [Erythranthe guttata]
MAVVLAVFAGYLLLWVMMPTNPYKVTWLPVLRAKTASTYFGTTQGATYLVFTFPILFIAALGCVYLHLGQKSKDNLITKRGNGDNRTATWKRPIVTKGLGIVSRIELAFFLMFVALLIWNLATYLRISFPKITPKSAAKSGEQVWEAKLDTAALRLGLVGNIALSFLFFPVTRGSSVLPLFGLTSEGSVKYHIWLGHMVMALFTSHGICYIIFWASTHELSEMLKWENTGVSNVAGEISLLAGLILWATTFPRIRRKMFELFFYTHHLYIVFVFFFVLHVGISYSSIMLPGFFLFVIDRFLRFLQSRRSVRLLSARVLPCQTVELNFSKTKGLDYNPTSTIFVNIPAISKLQWHPFTITSNNNIEPEILSVIIKCEGIWTKNLHQLVISPSVDRLQVSVEGPYGPTSTNFLRHDMVVMISGGSGITPFISIIKELIFVSSTLKSKTPKIALISVFKNSSHLSILDLILPNSTSINNNNHPDNFDLQIEAYVTRERGQPKEKISSTRNVFFKPNASDLPIYPTLGPNSWLWLGAIISSSFVIFLLLLGIFTQYVVYPVDKKGKVGYSYTKKASMNMFLVCFSIVVAASGAFLWNKKKNIADEDSKQIQDNTEEYSTAKISDDVELESLPIRSVIKSVNVQYGQRPDLKRILSGIEERSVGVLVSGPKTMRRDVAAICSAELADNLHYESISFTW